MRAQINKFAITELNVYFSGICSSEIHDDVDQKFLYFILIFLDTIISGRKVILEGSLT